jgi:hypothetical protein
MPIGFGFALVGSSWNWVACRSFAGLFVLIYGGLSLFPFGAAPFLVLAKPTRVIGAAGIAWATFMVGGMAAGGQCR